LGWATPAKISRARENSDRWTLGRDGAASLSQMAGEHSRVRVSMTSTSYSSPSSV
jgi:hypothetical protein